MMLAAFVQPFYYIAHYYIYGNVFEFHCPFKKKLIYKNGDIIEKKQKELDELLN
jgi:hypothetical protein